MLKQQPLVCPRFYIFIFIIIFSVRAQLLTFLSKITFSSIFLLDLYRRLRPNGKTNHTTLFPHFTETLTKSKLWNRFFSYSHANPVRTQLQGCHPKKRKKQKPSEIESKVKTERQQQFLRLFKQLNSKLCADSTKLPC